MSRMEQRTNIIHFDSINGLRAYAAIGIVLMHVKANGSFNVANSVISHILSLFTCFVFLFMMVSAFSMLCGYYDKFLDKTISVEQFYQRRYQKIWPFFALLVVIDVVVNFSKSSLIEGFADLTLVYSLLPNPSISVIGIGWTLGVIFVFYLLFPFFVYLMSNHRRAWFALMLSIIWNIVCEIYFFDSSHVVSDFGPRNNILYCSQFFVAGGGNIYIS